MDHNLYHPISDEAEPRPAVRGIHGRRAPWLERHQAKVQGLGRRPLREELPVELVLRIRARHSPVLGDLT
jgi:hypothetical protein